MVRCAARAAAPGAPQAPAAGGSTAEKQEAAGQQAGTHSAAGEAPFPVARGPDPESTAFTMQQSRPHDLRYVSRVAHAEP